MVRLNEADHLFFIERLSGLALSFGELQGMRPRLQAGKCANGMLQGMRPRLQAGKCANGMLQAMRPRLQVGL
ncbi:hypothetical protein [Paenibacillus chungangensis]|uniref:Uncharacterized protein n=1 Tax=Paenibacillus chungangensis TaxID=696535 RepID=A0ABW3HW01_9BACL